MKLIFALVAAVAGAMSATSPAVACSIMGDPEDIRRMFDEIKVTAPIVVEGYVKFDPEPKSSTSPSARLIPRKYIRGVRRSTYALILPRTSCDVQFPMDKRRHQKVYLQPLKGKFQIVSIEPLNE